MRFAIIGQLTAGEFAKIGHHVFQRFGLESLVKEDALKVGGHDHVGIDAQTFLSVAEIEAFRHDLASSLRDKHREPIHDSESNVEESAFGMKAVSFHFWRLARIAG